MSFAIFVLKGIFFRGKKTTGSDIFTKLSRVSVCFQINKNGVCDALYRDSWCVSQVSSQKMKRFFGEAR